MARRNRLRCRDIAQRLGDTVPGQCGARHHPHEGRNSARCCGRDGAGSAAHSEIGSWLASTTFVELVEVHFESGGRLVDIGRDEVVGWIANTAERLTARAT